MGWRQTFFGVAALLALAATALADEIEPPDYLAELKAKKDTTTIRPRSFGVVVSGELGAPLGGRDFRTDVSRVQCVAIGVFWRSRLNRADDASFTTILTFHHERHTPDPNAIVDRYRNDLGLPPDAFQSSGGQRRIDAVLLEEAIVAPWIDKLVTPHIRLGGGIGRYYVRDLVVDWDWLKFIYQGYDEWIGILAAAIGVTRDIGARSFVALEARALVFGSLDEQEDYVDVPAEPTHPPQRSQTPVSVGVHLTVGIGIF